MLSRCGRCNGNLIREEHDGTVALYCLACGCRVYITIIRPRQPLPPPESRRGRRPKERVTR